MGTPERNGGRAGPAFYSSFLQWEDENDDKVHFSFVSEGSRFTGHYGHWGMLVRGGAAQAKSKQPPFVGTFDDPFHPEGFRRVSVTDRLLEVTGVDEKNGKEWVVKGTLNDAGEVVLDFSVKGGPKNLLASWDEKGNGAIKFPDGNRWTRR